MNELEKVISGLACCTQNVRGQNTRPCDGCPYDVDGKAIACNTQLMADALALLKAFSAFKAYFDDLYGEGLEVANWHMNGTTEPFDSFYDSAMEEMWNV